MHITAASASFVRLLLAAALVLALSACNTIQGAGKDIEKSGEVIQEKAEDAKN
jgi:predicted small secreted protein